MQRVSEVMTRQVRSVSPQASLQHAAQMMSELDIGAIPVCDGDHLVGMVTDRDIAIRGVSAGKMPETARVEEVMSGEVTWCFEDQPLDELMRQMADSRIRRIPVVSHDDQHRLVGIVALGDLAMRSSRQASGHDAGRLMEEVSEPGAPARLPQTEGTQRDNERHTGFAHKDMASMAPTPGTSAGPGSTNDIGVAASTGLGSAATGAGNVVSSGGIATPTHTSAPARNLVDAAGGPSSPATPTVKPGQDKAP